MKITMKELFLGLQHVFAMFGATVLVPLLTGLDVGVALVASGIGTLIYILCTKGKVPMYLGSSFAFIGAIAAAGAAGGYETAFVGLMAVGLVYIGVAVLIRFIGSGFVHRIMPPIVVGPTIIIIGMSLAYVAVGSAGLDGTAGLRVPLVATITFASVVAISIYGRGFVRIIPFLGAILFGYFAALVLGIVDITPIREASLLQIPNFTFFWSYRWDFSAVLLFVPIALVTIAEHIGDHAVLGEIMEEDLITDPGLHRTLMGDGIATAVSGLIGGPANTSYGENIGVVSMTGVKSAKIVGIAAVIAILLGFLGYLQAFVYSIP